MKRMLLAVALTLCTATPALADRPPRLEHGMRGHDRGPRNPPPPPAPAAMASADFEALRAAIQREAFASSKVEVLRLAAANAWFTVGQVGQLLDLYVFSSDKCEVLRLTRPRVLDPYNSFQLFSHLVFESDKDLVRQLYGQ